ncbi:MAG: hypothetical protein IPN62_11725 [Flavobacteriales bacterium]|nr:hypothetical protein [Flavobacteriales bacterium]
MEAIGIIELLDAGERDDKLIAYTWMRCARWMRTISTAAHDARDIMVTWLLNY